MWRVSWYLRSPNWPHFAVRAWQWHEVEIYKKRQLPVIGGSVHPGYHSGVSVRLASGQDSCSEELGRLAVPQLRKWQAGSVARHDRRFVARYPRREREFANQIPRFSYNNILSFTCWYVRNMPCASFDERKLLNFKNCADHHLAPCQGLISGHSYKPNYYRCAIQCISPLQVCFECVTTIVYKEIFSLSPTFSYRWHRLT